MLEVIEIDYKRIWIEISYVVCINISLYSKAVNGVGINLFKEKWKTSHAIYNVNGKSSFAHRNFQSP